MAEGNNADNCILGFFLNKFINYLHFLTITQIQMLTCILYSIEAILFILMNKKYSSKSGGLSSNF